MSAVEAAWWDFLTDDRLLHSYTRRVEAFAHHRPLIEAAIRSEGAAEPPVLSEDMTTAYMVGYEAGKDAARGAAVAESLDDAWKAAEAALPEGSAVFGPWSLTVSVSRNPYGWIAYAGPFGNALLHSEFGDTPTAALRALASRLSPSVVSQDSEG